MSDVETSSEQASESQSQNQDKSKESPDDKLERIGKDRLAQFSSLLEESETEESEEEEHEEETDDDKDKDKDSDKDKDKDKDADKSKEGELKTLTDLAKKLGVKQSELYNIKLTLRDQETNVTLGELKDAYQESEEISMQKIEWGEQRAKEEQDLARGRKELEVLVSLVPKESLNKETLKQAAEIVNGQLERSRKDVLRRIPDWSDKDTRMSEAKEIDEKHLEKYGIKLGELTDSRLVHYIRNNWLREKRIEEALAKVRKVETKTKEPSQSSERNRGKRTTGRSVTPRAKSIARNFLNQIED